MPKTPSFDPVHTEKGWRVNVPKSMTSDGSRVRRFFDSLNAAKKYAASMRATHSSGVRGGLITVSQAMEAKEAIRILEGTGLSLVEASIMAAAVRNSTAAADNETFGQRYLRAMTAGEAIWSKKYADGMAKIPGWVGEKIMASKCGSLTKQILKDAVEEHGTKTASTVQMKMLRVMAVFNDRERKAESKPDIQIMTPRTSAKALRACHTKAQRRAVAVLIWAGVRPDADDGEISRLDWEAFGKTEIYISRDVSKTPQDRHIPITRRLRRLIKGHPQSGPVRPPNWKREWTRIRKEAGISNDRDICRHTFASNFLASYGEDMTKDALGHAANSRTLFGYYRRAVLKFAARCFFDEMVRSERLEALRRLIKAQ